MATRLAIERILHVTFEAPLMYAGSNQEQSFWADLTHANMQVLHQPCEISRIMREFHAGPIYVTGCIVSPQKPRVPQEFIPTGATIPFMLHHDPAVIRIEAYSGSHAQISRLMKAKETDNLNEDATLLKPAWAISIPYHFTPPGQLPRSSMSSNIYPIDEKYVGFKIGIREMLQEEITVGEPLATALGFFEREARAAITLTAAKVTRKGSDEAMTFYIDRIWSLAKFELFLPRSMLVPLGL